MAQNPTVETDGVQIKVWIPGAFYDLLSRDLAIVLFLALRQERRLLRHFLPSANMFSASRDAKKPDNNSSWRLFDRVWQGLKADSKNLDTPR